MNLDNVYSFTVQRQNSSEVAPGKSPCVKIKFIKDESIKNNSPRYKIGLDNISECTSNNGEEKTDMIIDDVSVGSSPLSICPIYGRDNNGSENMKSVLLELFKMIEKKDTHMIFAYPVTEDQAPNYSSIIDHPMDFQTIHHKIDSGEYSCVVDLVDDMILMCQNALIYNTSDTVYYKIAVQMLNYVRKIFSRDNVNKLVTTRFNWTKGLNDTEMGDWESCLTRLKIIQSEVTKNAPSGRPHRALQKNVLQQSMPTNKRKSQVDTKIHVAKKSCGQASLDTGNDLKPRSRVTMISSASPESEIDDNYSHNRHSEVSDDDADDEDEDDDDTINDVLATAQKAAMAAKQRLQQSQQRPVVYVDQIGDNVALILDKLDQCYSLEDDMQGMVKHIGSVNIEQMIGENDRILAQLGQLCHDPNEAVTLTTSKPLDPYSCAEQAVLVETFGDVVTAEFACNMHNFVLDMLPNSPALAVVKNKLNTATNYLTYGVDQIIIKKLKAAAEASKT